MPRLRSLIALVTAAAIAAACTSPTSPSQANTHGAVRATSSADCSGGVMSGNSTCQ